MEHKKFRCKTCRKICLARLPNQQYCSNPDCQKARKNEWRRQKHATDPEYRLTQQQSSKNWLESIGGSANYYREYRGRKKKKRSPKDNKAATKSSRLSLQASNELITAQQNLGNLLGEQGQMSLLEIQQDSANSDAGFCNNSIKTGRYLLSCVNDADDANSDAILVNLSVIT